MLQHAEALLLDVVDLQERDRIVTFLTAEHGRKRGVARSARTKFSRYAGLLQPLAKVKIGWFEKSGRELVRIGDVESIRPAATLQEDLEGILTAAYLADHMSEFAQEDDASAPLYRLLDTTIEAWMGGVDRVLAARYYEIWMLRLAGLLPAPWQCPLCGEALEDRAALLESEAAIVCPNCASQTSAHEASRVDGEVLHMLRRSARENLPTMALHPPSVRCIDNVERLCAKVRRHFLQGELRSYRMMRQTLAGIA